MQVSSEDVQQACRLVTAYLADATGEVELEVVVTAPIAQGAFVDTVAALRARMPVTMSVQLDVLASNRRYEFVGEELVRGYLDRGASEGPPASRVIVKRAAAPPVRLAEYPLKLNLKSEKPVPGCSGTVPCVANTSHRLKRRFSFAQVGGNVRVDCTIVQQVHNLPAAELGNAPRQYEVEVEAIGRGLSARALLDVMLFESYTALTHVFGESVLCTAGEKAAVLAAYYDLVGGQGKRGLVGPNPVTMEAKNLRPAGPGTVSIWEGYVVTDKADGERCQLFFREDRAYLLRAGDSVALAALKSPPKLRGTLLDGELIDRTRDGLPTRQFFAFDAYYHGDADVANLPLTGSGDTRLRHVSAVLAQVPPESWVDTLQVRAKSFVPVSEVSAVLAGVNRHVYNVDGLIFTPAGTAAGGRYVGDAARLEGRWPGALKWKPASHNTCDFLCRFSRHVASGVAVTTKDASSGGAQKTVRLMAGYAPGTWEPVDPIKVLSGTAVRSQGKAYVDKEFAVTDVPADDTGRVVCEEDGHAVEEGSIVEFWYDANAASWRPMRVRFDKEHANDWGTVQGVWRSIEAPVTKEMLTGRDPPPVAATDGSGDAYFARDFDRQDAVLAGMNTFHNIGVKGPLLARHAPPEGRLFEIACGKGGDLGRWLAAGFSTVVGCDSSLDNLVNPRDGIYARMVERGAQLKGTTMAFVAMDGSVRMRAPLDEVRRVMVDSPHGQVVAALWDLQRDLPAGLERYRGLASRGFDVVSCQFAVHYFWGSDAQLDRLIDNVAHLTVVGGHFVGTTFDGDAVSSALQSAGGRLEGRVKGLLAWSVERAYEPPFKHSTGAAVDVFVETIGQVTREYLVSFPTLTSRLKGAGFELVATEMFGDAARRLRADASVKDALSRMPPAARQLSELYRSFSFRRTR
jgi:hypothetical protein